jgi:hypothetical protein
MTAVLFAGAYLLFRSLIAAALAGGLFFAASLVSNLRFFENYRRRQIAVDDKAVVILDVEATRVLEIEHLGSHGPAHCFFVGDSTALLLVGQWQLENDSFPALAFRLHRWRDTGAIIRIETAGPHVEPEHSTVRLKPEYQTGDIEQFSASPETLQDNLDRAFHKQTASDELGS